MPRRKIASPKIPTRREPPAPPASRGTTRPGAQEINRRPLILLAARGVVVGGYFYVTRRRESKDNGAYVKAIWSVSTDVAASSRRS